jgi:hypothetical protein
VSPLRIEFHHPVVSSAPGASPPGPPAPPPPPPPPTVATATWLDRRPVVRSDDADLERAIVHAFRATPIVVDDPTLRQAGTRGEQTLQPGSLGWFRAVAQLRVAAETGLVARSVPGVAVGGYDPAANYRRFSEQIERLES